MRNKGRDYDYLFKLLLIGDSGVGKTSMLVRFADDTYSDTYVSTIGVDFKIKTVDFGDNIIKLQIWDTAGQDRFRSITSSYYRGAHGIIIAFDLTEYETFDNVKMWLKEVEKYADTNNLNLLLVGCKSDLEDDRKITYEYAKDYADSLHMPYIEVSSKYSYNINNVFDIMSRDILTRVITNEQNKIKSENIKLVENTVPVKRNGTCC